MVDLDEYRRTSLEGWDRFAGNWEEHAEFVWSMTRRVGERMVERLEPQPGETILELAAGIGQTGFLAARRLGEDGRLISTDFAPQMVEAARRRGEALGLGNVEYRVLDAERMDLDDDSVDGVLVRFGYMLMADPAAALRETQRVLRDGGTVVFAVWGPPEQNPWAFIPARIMVERGLLPPPEPGAPGIFAMGDPDRIRKLVNGAGFGEPEIEHVAVRWGYASADEHWEKTTKLAAAVADALEPVSAEERDQVRAAVAAEIEPLLAGDAGGVDGLVHVVLAR
jgi:SAM-dependent methyltransferase